MGIRFVCPNGHRLNVKTFLAGRRGICPFCGAKFTIPLESTATPGGDPLGAPGTSPDVAPQELAAAVPSSDFERDLECHVEQSAGTDLPGQSAVEDLSPPPPPTAPPSPSPMADPLAEAPTAVWYVRPPSGGRFGPAQPDLMRTWLDEGRIGPDSLVWREGWADWREAASVFSAIFSASNLPAAPPVATSTVAMSGGGLRPAVRRRTGPNLGLIIVLALMVVLLLVIFVWILQGGLGRRGSARSGAAGVEGGRFVALAQAGSLQSAGIGIAGSFSCLSGVEFPLAETLSSSHFLS